MALHSKKQFADLCGIATNNLSVQIGRGKVIVVNDLIDDTQEKNKAFLQKRISKNQPNLNQQTNTSVVLTENIINSQKNPIELIQPNENQSYTESERQLKYLDTLKRQAEIEKLSLDVAKKKGEVIPSELIKPVFLQHNQSIITEFKNVTDEIIRMFAKKKSLSVNEVAEITGELTSCINNAMNKATTATVNSIESIVNDFAEKKGVGERNV